MHPSIPARKRLSKLERTMLSTVNPTFWKRKQVGRRGKTAIPGALARDLPVQLPMTPKKGCT